MDRPVDIALALKGFGLSLSEAHAALNRVVAGEDVYLNLGGSAPTAIMAKLHDLGVEARQV